MTTDQRKTKSELIAELARLRRQADQAKKLKQQLKALRAECSGLVEIGDVPDKVTFLTDGTA